MFLSLLHGVLACEIEVQETEPKIPLAPLYHRYKQQLSLAAEREQILEQARVQAELDWQRRCENAERNHYQKSEDLIQKLSTARDQVITGLN